MVGKRPFLFLLGLTVALASSYSQAQENQRPKTEDILPAATTAWLSVPDIFLLKTRFDETNFGRLTSDSDMQPFIESLTDQFRDWANEKNVKLGLTVDDLEQIHSGEICFAGILPRNGNQQAGIGRGSHGVVVLVDVSGSMDEAEDLIKKVGEKMDEAGAEKVQMDPINGAEVSKWKWQIKTPAGKMRDQTTLQTIADGWLIASDNEAVFRDVIQRVKNPENAQNLNPLSAHPAFVKIKAETQLENTDPHIRWFVDPFGYMKLAQAIAAEDDEFKQRRDDIGEILEAQGFDAIRGVGGQVSFSTNDIDVLHRTFAYTPPQNVGEAQKRARGILDFRNKWKHNFRPEPWVPADSSGYATLTWDVESAFKNIGAVFDAFVDPQTEGDWETFVEGFNHDLSVNLDSLISKIDNRFSFMSAAEKPIDEKSERVVIGIKVKSDIGEVFEMASRLIGDEGEIQQIAGRDVIVVDTTLEDDNDLGGDLDIFGTEEEEEEEVEEFNLFEKRYIVGIPDVDADNNDEAAAAKASGYILICNNIEYLNKVLADAAVLIEKDGAEASQLGSKRDYAKINAVLDELIDPTRVSVRQFSRTDRVFETNYEMMRQGKMVQSQTVLARLLNEFMKSESTPDIARKQQIDGSKLPSDYRKQVAPFLGPAGWAMETTTEGWRITGVILKKNAVNEVVQKTDEEKSRR